jgi:hypothetical protein
MASHNLTSNGSVTAQAAIDDTFSVSVKGDFGGGTLTVYHSINGTNYAWQSGEGSTFTTAAEVILRNCGDSTTITATLTGATSPDLDLSISNNAYGA